MDTLPALLYNLSREKKLFWNRVFRPWMLAVLLAVIAAAPRVALLLTTERTPDGDECIVGLMAMHISQGDTPPIFFYGQHYGGGHVLEALAAAPFFSRFGVDALFVQAVPAVFSVLLVLLVFFWMGRSMGWGPGFFCGLVLAFSTPFLKNSFKADGYIETIFMGVLALYFLDRFFDARENAKKQTLFAMTCGGILGIAWWSYDFGLAYLFVVGLTALVRRREIRISAAVVFFIAFAAGASLLLYDNFAADFENIKHLIHGMPRQEPVLAGAQTTAVKLLLPHDLDGKTVPPALVSFLTRNSVHNFEPDVPFTSWIYAAIIVISGLICLGGRKTLRLPATVLLFPSLYLVMYLFSPHGGLSPRYLLLFEPFFSIFIVGAVVYFLRANSLPAWIAASAASVGAAAILALGVVLIHADNSIVEGNIHTDKRSLTDVVEFLDEKKIDCVYTSYFIKWRILFESRERINAMYILANQRQMTFPMYEEKGCPSSSSPAFVFHKMSENLPSLIQNLSRQGIPFDFHHTNDHMIIYVTK